MFFFPPPLHFYFASSMIFLLPNLVQNCLALRCSSILVGLMSRQQDEACPSVRLKITSSTANGF
ncbi:hypothetical protein BJX63DRAFT_382663 [Aspergillus granulosus]|uniref:Secreted protein n=1 Tax=Aspergillus granulosus TaxID=176169 RepID=A0ABR4HUM2_9EURO